MMEQQIIELENNYGEIASFFEKHLVQNIFLVCGERVKQTNLYGSFVDFFETAKVKYTVFSEFRPNPVIDSVKKGTELFFENQCDCIMAIGGGSAIDVAKCIKLHVCDDGRCGAAPLIVLPTTAGSGSEATKFAVVYRDGKKLSVDDERCVPSLVIRYSPILDLLPDYQKKATLLDALCHGIESYWSVNSTEESKEFSRAAIKLILKNADAYLNGDGAVNADIMQAAYVAGKAIHITKTTAGHAMAYKLTGIYGFSHGHAVAVCIDKIWPYMIEHIDDACVDDRGEKYLKNSLTELAELMGGNTITDGALLFHNFFMKLQLKNSVVYSEEELDMLVDSVNTERLSNHPILLDQKAIRELYESMTVAR